MTQYATAAAAAANVAAKVTEKDIKKMDELRAQGVTVPFIKYVLDPTAKKPVAKSVMASALPVFLSKHSGNAKNNGQAIYIYMYQNPQSEHVLDLVFVTKHGQSPEPYVTAFSNQFSAFYRLASPQPFGPEAIFAMADQYGEKQRGPRTLGLSPQETEEHSKILRDVLAGGTISNCTVQGEKASGADGLEAIPANLAAVAANRHYVLVLSRDKKGNIKGRILTRVGDVWRSVGKGNKLSTETKARPPNEVLGQIGVRADTGAAAALAGFLAWLPEQAAKITDPTLQNEARRVIAEAAAAGGLRAAPQLSPRLAGAAVFAGAPAAYPGAAAPAAAYFPGTFR